MYIAMNRFRVKPGSEAAFEHHWLTRESLLHELPGFLEFHILRGPERADHRLYSSYTLWTSKAAFEAWTQSEQFKIAHARTGRSKVEYLGPPEFEAFDVLQSIGHHANHVTAAEEMA
jgi:heme-degrading monooxygenase HmoA